MEQVSSSLGTIQPSHPSNSYRRGDARTSAILQATLGLISEIGYERVTMDAIVTRAHSSKATLYSRWNSKAEVVAEALRRNAQGISLAVPDTGSTRDDLVIIVGQIVATFKGDQGPSLIGLIEAIRDHSMLRELVGAQIRERSYEVVGVVCSRALARNQPVDPEKLKVLFEIVFNHMLCLTLFSGQRPSSFEQVRVIDEMLLPLLGHS
jgi:AcrR family transcriptional regulator